jgi:hypothetical protein
MNIIDFISAVFIFGFDLIGEKNPMIIITGLYAYKF